jgi:putative ABC transport system ATP-binding protein
MSPSLAPLAEESLRSVKLPMQYTDKGSLLLRFYDPTSGKITLNGTDIREYNVKQFRRHISVVPQEPVLFSGSLAENIAYGKPQATPAEILAAARRANCNFIGDFPEGLDTEVGSRGAQLSGGQKQACPLESRLMAENCNCAGIDSGSRYFDP